MACSPTLKKCSLVFWPFLVGTTFLCCCLIIYTSIFSGGRSSTSLTKFSGTSIQTGKFSRENCESVCTAKECVDTSNRITSLLDESVDPCEDFYSFACGKYIKRYKGSNNSLIDESKWSLYRTVKDIIENSEEPFGSAAHKVKVVYDSCMNKGSSELSALGSVQHFLNQIGIPNWPHLNSSFQFRNNTMDEVLGRLASYQEYVFIRFNVEPEYYSMKWMGHLFNFTVTPQYRTYEDQKELEELKNILTNVLHSFGLTKRSVNRTLNEFLSVEFKILELFKNNSESTDVCEDENVGNFYNCPQDGSTNRNTLCNVLNSVIRHARLTYRFSKDRVYISCLHWHYIENIFSVLKRYNHRALAHYIALRVIINNLKHLNFSVRKQLKSFERLPFSYEEFQIVEVEKWKMCVAWLVINMKQPVEQMYTSRVWSKNAINEIDEMVEEYKNETSRFIKNQEWMDESNKRHFLSEIKWEENHISSIIAKSSSKTKNNIIYKRFRPTKRSFIRNVLEHKKFYFTTSMLYPKAVSIFGAEYPFDASAYSGSGIYLSFGILFRPIYGYGYPKIVNLAKIGHIIGHEIGHTVYNFLASDTQQNGSMSTHFSETRRCLMNQYSDFEMKSIKRKIRGEQTITENFPDNVALQVTEQLIAEMDENELKLPGLPYSSQELMYISYAQTWCEAHTVEKAKLIQEEDEHSISEFRIKGAFQNSERFARAFRCPESSSMNPKKKCFLFK